jgi:DNA excision repair protein ERCC-6
MAAYLSAAASSRKLKSVLIITPATMLQHWLSELAVWAPGLRRILIHTSGGEVDGLTRNISSQLLVKLSNWLKEARSNRLYEAIDEKDWETMEPHSFCGTGYAIVTTYENFRRYADIYVAHDWSYVILDEAQKIRNPDADITLACKRIRTPHRIGMSGTPIQNDLRELWSLFDFVFPGRLGTLPAFEQEFAVPIKRGGYSNASPMQVQLAYRCALMLRDLIEPFLLRRLKRDVKEVSRMPGKTEHVLFCRLSKRQREMYEAYLQSDDVRRVLRGSTQMLAAVTMLRKITNHPDLVCDPSESSFQSFVQSRGMKSDSLGAESDDSDEEIADEESLVERCGKLEVLSKILPHWHKQGHRFLIFCQWRKMLNIVQRFTMMNRWKVGRLDGNTNIAARQRLVDTFNSDKSYFGMLCTTRTGGVGLNLTGANRIVLFDPDWNPSSDAQARERAWRFGQEKDVTVYRLITAGTIEEKIYQRQIFKTALSNKILQDPQQRRLFSQRDLRDLFSLGADTGTVQSGSDGLTQTTKVTKGIGIVDRDVDLADSDDSDNDNNETLRKAMKSRGLAGIFDHHAVEPDFKRKSATVLEMEVQAKRVAKEAADALQKSMANTPQDRFMPTWTGSVETRPSNFGPANPTNASMPSSGGPAATSSLGLLASLRQRNAAIESSGTADEAKSNSSNEYAELLGQVTSYVRSHNPTTEALLEEFDTIPASDVAIFRRLLKSVATISNGRWRLSSP